MTSEPEPQDDPESWAALYLAGALDDEERAALEARLRDGDEQLRSALRELEPGIQAFGADEDGAGPSASVRDLLTRLAGTAAGVPAPPIESGEAFVRTSAEGDWVPTASPGVSARSLFFDPESRIETLLLRMEPGAVLHAHPHGSGGEECFMIEGDAFSAGYALRAGDYQRLPPGQHDPVATRAGCLVLVRVSRP
ncbi:MAG: cupin domain-containing protein [Isosphaeraceae bacterium]